MDKKLSKKIELLVFLTIILLFSIIIFKYIIKNNTDVIFSSKQENIEKIIQEGAIKNKEYNKKINDPEKESFAFTGQLFNSGGVWTLSGAGSENFQVFNYEGHIGIKKLNNNNNKWSINFDSLEKYYPVNNIIKLDAMYNSQDKEFRIYEQEDYLPIYGYHSIIDDASDIKTTSYEIKKSKFDNQIKYLSNELGCRWFTVGYLAEKYISKNIKTPKNACVLNFDDGRRNNYTVAYPVMKKYGAIGTYYIIIDLLGKGEYMAIDEANTLYQDGNEIGSHTLFGGSLVNPIWFLRKVGRTITKDDIYEQIKKSKDKLEERGYIVKTFAYPLGEWNEEIVQTVKESGYIGARDITKRNVWKDKRTQTISYEEDRIWHLNYIKPELRSLDDLKKDTGYNTWWQFEDGYKVINTFATGSIRELSSVKLTDTSYGVISLGSLRDEISNKFIISKSGSYIINIFGSTGNQSESDMLANISIKVDGQVVSKAKDNSEECIYSSSRYFCYYRVAIDLDKGVHTINIANSNRLTVYIDKFNIFRNIEYKDTYNLSFFNN